MSEYIDRESAIEATWEILNGLGYSQKVSDRLVEEVEGAFDDIPAADVAPVRRGRWNVYSVKDCLYTCSECHCLPRDRTPHCPNCGAKMEEE